MRRPWIFMLLLLTGCPSSQDGGTIINLPGFPTKKPTPTPTVPVYNATPTPTPGPTVRPTATPVPVPTYGAIGIGAGNPSNAWMLSEPMSTLRAGLSAVALNGKLYAFEGDGYSTIEGYDPPNRLWSAHSLGYQCRYFSIAGILGGKLYEVGGMDGLSDLADGIQYDFAGSPDSIAAMPVLSGVRDATAANGSTTPVRERSHMGGGVLRIANEEVLVVAGGEVGNTLVNNAVKTTVLKQLAFYFPPTATATQDAWIQGNDLPSPRSAMGSAVIDNRLYLFGGYDQEGNVLSSLILYDPASDRWSTTSPASQPLPGMSRPRHSFMSAVLGGKIYAIGGVGADRSLLRDVEEYDPQTNRWRTMALMPTARALGAAVALTDRIYVLGGFGADGRPLRTVEVFFP